MVMVLAILAARRVTASQEPVADGPPYEMDTYQVAFLKRGPTWTAEVTPEVERLQAAHMANMQRLANEQKLIGGGPFVDGGQWRGLFIFKVGSVAEARALSATDPAVQAGRLALDVYEWWGPKGVGEPYRARVRQNPDAPADMRRYQLAVLQRGPAWTQEETPERQALQRRHLGYLTQLTEEGVLRAAGPLDGSDGWLGLAFYQLDSPVEARARAEADPAVRAGRMTVEVLTLMMDSGVLPATGR
jgi:uncharacterized protein YciI